MAVLLSNARVNGLCRRVQGAANNPFLIKILGQCYSRRSPVNMATFHPNPDENSEPWIERSVKDDLGFRIWHLFFFCFVGLIVLVIFICCCVKIRIPRTKQEIEADYQRKKIATKFREKLKLIENQEMDAMDLRRALEIIQEDLRTENKSIDEQLSLHMNPSADYNISLDSAPQINQSGMKAEPQQPPNGGITNRLKTLIKAKKFLQQESSSPSQSVP